METIVLAFLRFIRFIANNKTVRRMLVELIREQYRRTPDKWDDIVGEAIAEAIGKAHVVDLRLSKAF